MLMSHSREKSYGIVSLFSTQIPCINNPDMIAEKVHRVETKNVREETEPETVLLPPSR